MKKVLVLTAILAIGVMGALQGGVVGSVQAETTLFESGWEDGQAHGRADSVEYKRQVAGYFNSSSPPPECSRRQGETEHNGRYSLMIAGYSRASYAYCYYRVFDEDLDVVEGMKIGYWINHFKGTPKVGVDGHFKDGRTFRDFGGGALTDQNNVRIHPAHRPHPDPDKTYPTGWHYVEVDLSPAAGKTIDFIMFAFDNGNDGFRGQYRAYVDDFRIFLDDTDDPPPSDDPPPATSSDLYGLCINANYGDQNPPDYELEALGVRWVRSIRYQHDFAPHGNVKWLVIFNQETIPRNGGESWDAYVERFSNGVRDIVRSNSWISAIEVWNEQDLRDDCEYCPGFGRYITPDDYAPLLKATYQKVKQLPNPPIVITGGLASGPDSAASYLNRVREVNRGSHFDAAGFHPYLHTVDGLGWYSTMESAINTFYRATGGRPIWLTEFGAAYQQLDNDKQKQARYLEGCYRLFDRLKDGSRRKVGVAFWFAWDDRTHWNPSAESFGLVEQHRSGDPNNWRRPAWHAYYELTHDGANPPDPEPDPDPDPDPSPGRTNKIHGTVVDCNGNPQAGVYVSIWRHDNGDYRSKNTNASGIYEFTNLDPDQLYNMTVNAVYDPNNCDCCPFRRVDTHRNSAVRNNVELIDGGDGWRGENFWLCSQCP